MESLETVLECQNRQRESVTRHALGHCDPINLEVRPHPKRWEPLPLAANLEDWFTKPVRGILGCQANYNYKYVDIVISNADENQSVLRAIADAEEYLSWQEDWDDEGAKPFKRETFERTKKLLMDCNRYVFKNFYYRIVAPEILPGLNGSLKVFWNMANFKLLMTIPEGADLPISYYGEDKSKIQTVEATFTENVHATGLFNWLYEEMKNASI
ncbi:MAG TPA: hypothetical protein VKF42_05025 [Chitinivibrionales bacterium]|jgi:hypothetical protein|nr:hypothetical protein [Chitinivibrionales bacterium]